MSDQALLEKLATLAGIPWTTYDTHKGLCINGPMDLVKGTCWWNPLEDDGDALRLAVRYELNLIYLRYAFPKRLETVRYYIVKEAINALEALQRIRRTE